MATFPSSWWVGQSQCLCLVVHLVVHASWEWTVWAQGLV